MADSIRSHLKRHAASAADASGTVAVAPSREKTVIQLASGPSVTSVAAVVTSVTNEPTSGDSGIGSSVVTTSTSSSLATVKESSILSTVVGEM